MITAATTTADAVAIPTSFMARPRPSSSLRISCLDRKPTVRLTRQEGQGVKLCCFSLPIAGHKKRGGAERAAPSSCSGFADQPVKGRIRISTRRFWALPSGVALEPIGARALMPAT